MPYLRTSAAILLHRILVFMLIICALSCAVAVSLAPTNAFARATVSATIGEAKLSTLPKEAQAVLKQIKNNGPYDYAKDGVTFSNRERILPKQKRGYYREFTVKTPGARNRGARRIIAGNVGEYFYTDDHYASFKRIKE